VIDTNIYQFLGDAVLVSFQANQFDKEEQDSIMEEEKSTRTKHVLVRKAVECGLQLLARQSHYRVYLTAEERSKHRSSATGEIDRRVKTKEQEQRFFLFDGSVNDSEGSVSRESLPNMSSLLDINHSYAEEYSTAFNFWNCIPVLFGKGRKNRVYATRRASDTSDTTKKEPDAIDLELHIALSCGDVTNVILGDVKAESPSTTPTTNEKNQRSRFSYISTNGSENPIDYTLDYAGRLEYAICGPAIESLEDALSAAKAGEMSITPEAFELFHSQSITLSYEKRKQFYVVKSSDATVTQPNRKGPGGWYYYPTYGKHAQQPLAPNVSNLADKPGLMTRASILNLEPLIPRSQETSYLELASDQNPNYIKYINRSALYRLQHSPDDNFPAQFRDVTIMFISLGKLNVATPEGIQLAQRAAHTTIQALVKFEGLLTEIMVQIMYYLFIAYIRYSPAICR
jgi:hypothetical protein